MRTCFVVILLISVLALSLACSRTSKGIEAKKALEEEAPATNVQMIQTAITGMLLEARVNRLDDSYDEVDTREEVQNVTAGKGAYNLSEYLITSYPLNPPIDISKTGKVTID